MSLLLGMLVLFVVILVGSIMIIFFPRIIPPFVDLQQQTPGTDGLGGYGEFHMFILLFIVPLVFLGMGIIAAFIIGSMRQEAHRGRL